MINSDSQVCYQLNTGVNMTESSWSDVTDHDTVLMKGSTVLQYQPLQKAGVHESLFNLMLSIYE